MWRDPLALFTQLTRSGDDSLLLGSAEIDTKAGTQSLLLIDACVRLTCLGATVTAEALNANGETVLDTLQSALPTAVQCQRDGALLNLRFPTIDASQDEDSRLKAPVGAR